jgi:hypothetical protein
MPPFLRAAEPLFHNPAGSIATFFIKISGPHQREIERVF